MNELVLKKSSLETLDFVAAITGNCVGDLIQRVQIEFKNGLMLSVITGLGACCSTSHPYEIAVFKDEEFNNSFLDEEDKGDDVVGYCDAEKVKKYINKIGSI